MRNIKGKEDTGDGGKIELIFGIVERDGKGENERRRQLLYNEKKIRKSEKRIIKRGRKANGEHKFDEGRRERERERWLC